MTDAEAAKLKPGDRLRWIRGPRVDIVRVVVNYHFGSGPPAIRIRPEGMTRAGAARPSVEIGRGADLHFMKEHDPVTANVFADWLAEQGEYKAADMLRAAFPYSVPAEASDKAKAGEAP